MHLQRFNTFYKFLVEFEGRIIFTSTSTTIEDAPTVFSFQVNTGRDILSGISNYKGIETILNFSNSSSPNFFEATFNDPGAVSNTTCLVVTKRNVSQSVIVNTSCISGSTSGVLQVQIDEDITELYEAVVTGTTPDGESFVLNSLSVNLEQDFKN